MTSTQLAQVLALAAIGVAVLALIFAGFIFRTMRRLQRAQRVVLGVRGEDDIVAHVVSVDEKLNNLRVALEDVTVAGRDHEACIDGCLSRVGIVRFDAYHDLGGHQSSAVAFLDARENGVVITTVVSRDFARIYVKNLKNGQPDIPLAPEELEAVDQARARGNAPFTVRPRISTDADPDAVDSLENEEERQEALRVFERENRRRKRRGLPLLPDQSAPPSGLGWPKIQLPPVAVEDPPAEELSTTTEEGSL